MNYHGINFITSIFAGCTTVNNNSFGGTRNNKLCKIGKGIDTCGM